MRAIAVSFLLIFSLINKFTAQSSCLSEGLIISSSSDITNFKNNYPDCTHIIGKLFAFTPVSSLDGMQQIKSIGGDLGLCCTNWSFKDLKGLENLESVGGYVHISSMHGLKNLAELSKLKTIGTELKIFNNDILENLDGLENLESVGGYLDIQWNQRLVDVKSLNKLSSIGSNIEIDGNDILEEISGFLNTNHIKNSITISDNPLLQDLQFLENIDSIGNYLSIRNNSSLTDLKGLENLKKVGESITIERNDMLQNLDGLQNLKTIGRSLTISNNDTLNDLNQINQLHSIGQDLYIRNNKEITSIAGFDSLRDIGSSLFISQNTSLESIDGFANLESMKYTLRVSENKVLNDMQGFSNLHTIGGLLFTENDTLPNFDDLSNLKLILGPISITQNRNLIDITGLENINPAFVASHSSSGFDLLIRDNIQLSECQIQPICRLIEKYGEKIYIQNNGSECDEIDDFICSQNSILGEVYYDRNKNGTKDNNEFGVSGQTILLSNTDYQLFSDDNGRFKFLVDSGTTYNVSIELDDKWASSSELDYEFTFTPGDSINNKFDFGIYLIEEGEYGGSISMSSEPTRCNTEVTFYLRARNTASGLFKGFVEFNIDPLTQFASPFAPDENSESKITYDIGFIYPFEYVDFDITLQMPSEQETGSPLEFSAVLLRDNFSELVTLDEKEYHETVLCSYDPNDKMVSPPGEKDKNYTLTDEKLSYTVRFQNTGNADAIDIRIRDTISSYLDMNTLEIVNSSFPLDLSIRGNALEFLFENIYLPDSTSNEPLSHGFVTYEISPLDSLIDFAQIENTAHIIFDFNPAIVTNTTINTMVDSIGSNIYMFRDTFACAGDTLLGFTSNATISDTIDNLNLCFSISNLNINFIEPKEKNSYYSVCPGDTIFIYDIDYVVLDKTITVFDSIFDSYGCLDSINTINIAPIAAPTITENITICEGDTYQEFTETGEYEYLKTNVVTGCDELVLLSLTVIPTSYYSIDTTICEGYSYLGFEVSGTFNFDSLNMTTGCIDEYELTLQVLPISDPLCTTATSDLSIRKITITPNPTKDYLTITSAKDISSYRLFDIAGNLVREQNKINSTALKLDLEHLNAGVYVLKIESDDLIDSFRIVKI